MTNAYPNTELHINGKWTAAAGGETLDVLQPQPQKSPLATLPMRASPIWMPRLRPPEAGFRVWKQVPALERYNVMRKAANLVRERADEIAAMMTMEQGKTHW